MQNMKIPRSLDIAAFIIIIAGVMYAQVIVTQLLLALFISIVCAQPILWLQKRKVSKGLSILIVFLGIVIVFGGLGDLVKSSLSSFSQNAPTYQENLGETISSTHHLLDKNKACLLQYLSLSAKHKQAFGLCSH